MRQLAPQSPLSRLLLAGALAVATQAYPVEFASFPAPGAIGDGYIASGSDGNLYFTQPGNRLGRITPDGIVNRKRLSTPEQSDIAGIAVGEHDDIWITDRRAGSVGTMKLAMMAPNTRADLSEHALPQGAAPEHIVRGQDDNLWVSDRAHARLLWLRGTFFSEYRLPSREARVGGMALGADGNLWFTMSNLGSIGRAMPGGIVSEFPLSATNSRPSGITAGADGGVWFTDPGTDTIGRVDPDTLVTTWFSLPAGTRPLHICFGSDGNVWFTSAARRSVGRLTPQGRLTEFALPTGADAIEAPGALTLGHDGNLWFLARDEIGVIKDASFVAPPPLVALFSFEVATHTEFEKHRSVAVVVKRSGNTTERATVTYAISDSRAAGAVATIAEGTLTFEPDEVAKLVSIPIAGQTGTPERTFKVRLARPSANARLGAAHEAEITVSEPPRPGEDRGPARGADSVG